MRLTEKAIQAIAEKNITGKIMDELKVSPSSIYRIIKENKSNGPLTSAGALSLIRQETALTDDVLLERESFS